MVIIKLKKRFYKTYTIFFAESPSFKHFLTSYYMQAISTNEYFGFHRISKYTKVVNLQDVDYENSFTKNTLYEIKRASRDGVCCEVTTDNDMFIEAYNRFSMIKNLKTVLSTKYLQSFGDNLIITMAKSNDGHILAFHSYILDKSIKRVRLMHSVSLTFTISDNLNIDKGFIGRANRLLHQYDMEMLKKMGFETYDFGGYAFNTENPSLKGINSFKDSFGGILIEESIYESYPLYLVKKILTFKKKL